MTVLLEVPGNLWTEAAKEKWLLSTWFFLSSIQYGARGHGHGHFRDKRRRMREIAFNSEMWMQRLTCMQLSSV